MAGFGCISLVSELAARKPGPGSALLVGGGVLVLVAFIRKAASIPMIRTARVDNRDGNS